MLKILFDNYSFQDQIHSFLHTGKHVYNLILPQNIFFKNFCVYENGTAKYFWQKFVWDKTGIFF